MLLWSAQPRSSISAPAKGSTGQKPTAVAAPATRKVPAHVMPKNSNAPRVLNEQCGMSSMRAAGVNTGRDYTSQFIGWLKDLRLRAAAFQELPRRYRRPFGARGFPM